VASRTAITTKNLRAPRRFQARGEGKSLRQIADVVGVSEKAIRKQLRRLGWPAAKAVQAELQLFAPAADPNVSGSAAPAEDPDAAAAPAADPNVSGSAARAEEPDASWPSCRASDYAADCPGCSPTEPLVDAT
jgi:hypothetical protein